MFGQATPQNCERIWIYKKYLVLRRHILSWIATADDAVETLLFLVLVLLLLATSEGEIRDLL